MKQVGVDKLLQHYVLVDGAPIDTSGAVVCAHFQPAFADGEAVSQVFWYVDGVWRVGPMLGLEAVSMVYSSSDSVATVLGRNGELARVSAASVLEEKRIDRELSAGPFRRLRHLGQDLIAIGGVRSVYQVDGPVARLVTDGGVAPLTFDSEEDLLAKVVADSDIWFDADGVSSTHFVAVGSGGSIVFIDGPHLTLADSSTNIPFYCVWRLPSGAYLCGGRGGLLFRGDATGWSEYAVVPGATDICSIVEFNGRVFVCDGQGVFVQAALEAPFDADFFGQRTKVPAHSLRVGLKSLISIAGKEAFQSEDGKAWKALLG